MEAAPRTWMVVGLLAEVVGIAAVTATLAVGRDVAPARPLASPAAGSTRIWHEDALTLIPDQGADLDAPAYDPEWGSSGDTDGPGTAFDVLYGPAGLSRAGWAFDTTLTLLPSPADGPDPCTSAPGYGAAPVPLGELTPGARICVRTGNGRVSLLQVVRATRSSGTFAVVTFATPGDES